MFYVNLPLRRFLFFWISYAFLQVLSIGNGHFYAQSSRENFETFFAEYSDKYRSDAANLKSNNSTLSNTLTAIARQISEAKHFSQLHDSLNLSSNALFDKAVINARFLDDDGILAFSLVQRGFYYYHMRKLALARPDFMEAMLLLDRNPKIVPAFPAEVYKQLGYFFGGVKDCPNGTKFLIKSLEYMVKDDERAEIYDNLGIYAINMGDLLAAQNYLDQAWKCIVSVDNPIRKAKILGSFASLEKEKGDDKQAIELWAEDIAISRNNKADLNTLYASNKIADLLIANGRLQEAQEYLLAIKPFADHDEKLVVHRKDLNDLLLKIAIGQRDEKEEVRLRRLLAMMQDSLNLFDGDFVSEQTKWLNEKAIINENLRKASSNYNNVRSIVVFGSIILVLFGAVTFSWRYLRNRRLARRAFFADTLPNSEPDSFVPYDENGIADYSAILDDVEPAVEDSLVIHLRKEMAEMLNDFDGVKTASYLVTDERWRMFKNRFVLECPDIYETVVSRFSDVSGGSLRVVLLWALNFNVHETAQLLGISADAVKKSKQRLRKKMGDERYKQLVDYLEKIEN